MKIVELTIGIDVQITNEESDLLAKLTHEAVGGIKRSELNEREIVVANNMVNKDVLYRKNHNGIVTYYKKI